MRPVLDRGEVGQLAGRDEAPEQALAGQARERGLRRPADRGDQVGGEAAERDHGDVGDGAEPPHQQVADARAHVGRADDDRERRERAASPELLDALAERVFELREAAAHQQPSCLIVPRGHRVAERITRP